MGYGYSIYGKNDRLVGYLTFDTYEEYQSYSEYIDQQEKVGMLDGIKDTEKAQGFGTYYSDYYAKTRPEDLADPDIEITEVIDVNTNTKIEVNEGITK